MSDNPLVFIWAFYIPTQSCGKIHADIIMSYMFPCPRAVPCRVIYGNKVAGSRFHGLYRARIRAWTGH